MYVICDLAMNLILSESNNEDVRDFSLDMQIPSMYYKAQPDNYQNEQSYIPDKYLPYNSGTTNATNKTGIVVPVGLAFLCQIHRLLLILYIQFSSFVI